MTEIVIPTLSYAHVKRKAEDFLQEHHPTLEIPIPIEEITELDLGMTISSVARLKQLFDIDGFINSDFSQITIDDWVFNNCEERARFTIAHELGHKILHRNIYEAMNITTLDEYVNFQNNIPYEDYKKMERQAHWFAGNILVPPSKLKEQIALSLAKRGIMNSTPYPPLITLPKAFNVSQDVLMIQLQKEGLLRNGF